jgi:N-acetylglutamate synthase-like GNAT family acetyltransferase
MSDMGHVVGMELRTQEYPMLSNDVRPYFTEAMRQVYVADIQNRLIGYLMMNFLKDKSVAVIDSIGVLPLFRNKGVGKKLVDHASTAALANTVQDIRMYVPSYVVDDMSDPWNIDHWLWKIGFKAVGVVHAACFRYGYHYDYYIFERLPT